MDKALGRISNISGTLAVSAFALNFCLYDVDGGKRAVMFDNLRGGIQSKVIGEGTHFKIPVVQRPVILDVRTKPREIVSVTGTKDLQMANLKLRVLWRPVIKHLPQLYRELGTDFDERVLPSVGNEVLKAVVAHYNAEELLSKRAEVSERIKSEMKKRAEHFHITLDDVAIRIICVPCFVGKYSSYSVLLVLLRAYARDTLVSCLRQRSRIVIGQKTIEAKLVQYLYIFREFKKPIDNPPPVTLSPSL